MRHVKPRQSRFQEDNFRSSTDSADETEPDTDTEGEEEDDSVRAGGGGRWVQEDTEGEEGPPHSPESDEGSAAAASEFQSQKLSILNGSGENGALALEDRGAFVVERESEVRGVERRKALEDREGEEGGTSIPLALEDVCCGGERWALEACGVTVGLGRLLSSLRRPVRAAEYQGRLRPILKKIQATIIGLEVYYDARWVGFRSSSSSSQQQQQPLAESEGKSKEAAEDIFPAEFLYKVKVFNGEFLFQTRWQDWHAKYDTWEPEENFNVSGCQTPSEVYFRKILDILMCRYLQYFALFAALEQLVLTNHKSFPPKALDWTRQLLPTRTFRPPWVQLLLQNVQICIPRLLPCLQTLFKNVNNFQPQLSISHKILTNPNHRLLHLLTSYFFPTNLAAYTPSEQMHHTNRSTATPILWADHWLRMHNQEIQNSKASNQDAILAFSFLHHPLQWSEVRLPRRLPSTQRRDPFALWYWRKLQGTCALQPFQVVSSNDPFNPHPISFIENFAQTHISGRFVGPIQLDVPSQISKLWMPPWGQTAKDQQLTLFARYFLPPYSTTVSIVPDKVLEGCQVEEQEAYLISFKPHYGRSSPPSEWLSCELVKYLYPHLLVDYRVQGALSQIRQAMQVSVRMIIARCATESVLPLVESWLREYPPRAGAIEITSYWKSRPEALDLTAESDAGSCILMQKWDMLVVRGGAKEVAEVVQFFFDCLALAELEEDMEEEEVHSSEGGSVNLRFGLFLYLTGEEMKLFESQCSGIISFLLTCGFHPNPGQREPNYAFPNFDIDGRERHKDAHLVAIDERLGKIFEPDAAGALHWPLFICDVPSHAGHILTSLVQEIAARKARRQYQVVFTAETLRRRIDDRLQEAKAKVVDGQAFEPAKIPHMWTHSNEDLVTMFTFERQLHHHGVQLENLAAKLNLPTQENLPPPKTTPPLPLAYFRAAFDAAMVAFGAPSPLLIGRFPEPPATITSLGNLLFRPQSFGDNLPWKNLHDAKDDIVLEDRTDQVLNSDTSSEDRASAISEQDALAKGTLGDLHAGTDHLLYTTCLRRLKSMKERARHPCSREHPLEILWLSDVNDTAIAPQK